MAQAHVSQEHIGPQQHLDPAFIMTQRTILIGIHSRVRRAARTAPTGTLDEPTTVRLSTPLDKIVRALEQIEEGTYGICDECEGNIPRARLEAVPSAVCCTDCQEKQEHAVKLRRMRAASMDAPDSSDWGDQDGDPA